MEDKEIKVEEEQNSDDNSAKKILIVALLLTLLIFGVVGISFATFNKAEQTTSDNTISTGTISMTYTENTNGISITNALPTTDTAGKVLNGDKQYFDFTVSSTITGDATINYEITAIKDQNSSISNNYIKLYLEKETSNSYKEVMKPTYFTPITAKTTDGSPTGSMVLASGTLSKNVTENYRLRMWLADNAPTDLGSKYFMVRVNVYGFAK
jgi:hypothetical protein